MSFWDGTRWVSEHAPSSPGNRRRWRDWAATVTMILVIAAFAMPFAITVAGSPTMSMTPSRGTVGTAVTVVGQRFPAKSQVQLFWDGSSKGLPAASVNRRGSFAAKFVVPSGRSGQHTLAAAQIRTTSSSSSSSFATFSRTSERQAVFASAIFVVTDPSSNAAAAPAAPATALPSQVATTPATEAPPVTAANPTPDVTPDPTAVATPVPTPVQPGPPAAIPTADPTKAPPAAPTPTAAPKPTPEPTPEHDSTGMYGPAIGMDGIGNTQVGGPNGSPSRLVGYRFRATTSSDLKTIQFATMSGPGYSGGTFGKLSITVQTDNGSGYPSGTVLASATFQPQDLCCTWPTVSFGDPASLSKGKIYFIVFKNTDPNPATNFPSLNNLYVGTETVPRQPRFADSDWAEVLKDSSSWWTRPDYTPTLGLYYSNGVAAGVGYAYIGTTGTISGSSQVRETFTVSGSDRYISTVGIRLKSVSGSSGLVVRLETSGGTVLDTVTIPASAVKSGRWAKADFGTTHKLDAGTTYNLQLSTAGSSRYTLMSMYQGSSYGAWKTSTYFADGRAQTNTGGSWSNWGGRTDQDIQFYLH